MKINFTFNSGKRISFLAKIIVLTLAVLIAGYLLPGVRIESVASAILASVVIALLNIYLRPILVVLTLPFTVFSMGFFLLFINAFIIHLTSLIIKGVEIKSFGWALLFSIVITIISSLLEVFAKLIDRRYGNGENETEGTFNRREQHFDDYEDITDIEQEDESKQ